MPKALQRASAMLLEASGKMLFCQTLLEDVAEDNSERWEKAGSTLEAQIRLYERLRFNQKVIDETLRGVETLFAQTKEDSQKALDAINERLLTLKERLNEKKKPPT